MQTAAKIQSFLIAGLFLELLLLIGCGQAGKAPFIEGSWAVIGHEAPRISAMGREEAGSWVGKVAHYTEKKASFDGTVCESPLYKRRALQAEDLYSGFRISPQSLGYKEGPIEIIEVYCGNREWVTPGGMLLMVGENRLYLIWDGIFFRLQKQEQKK